MKFIKKYLVYIIILLLIVTAVVLTIVNRNRSQKPQSVGITTMPSDSQIYINNIRYNNSPSIIKLKPGKYSLYVTKENYLPTEQSIEIKANKTNTFNITLKEDIEYQPVEGAPAQ